MESLGIGLGGFGFSQKTAETTYGLTKPPLAPGSNTIYTLSVLHIISRITYKVDLREYIFNRASEGIYAASAQDSLK